MPTLYSDQALTCDRCGATRERPLTRGVGLEGYKAEQRAFTASGWRMIPNPYEQTSRLLPRSSLVSCLDCPPAEPGDPGGVYRAAGSAAAGAQLSGSAAPAS